MSSGINYRSKFSIMKQEQHKKDKPRTDEDTGKTAAKHSAPAAGKQKKKQTKKKKSDKDGILEKDFGKDFLETPGDPETAQRGLI